MLVYLSDDRFDFCFLDTYILDYIFLSQCGDQVDRCSLFPQEPDRFFQSFVFDHGAVRELNLRVLFPEFHHHGPLPAVAVADFVKVSFVDNLSVIDDDHSRTKLFDVRHVVAGDD